MITDSPVSASRREILVAASVLGTGAVLAGCSSAGQPDPQTSSVGASPTAGSSASVADGVQVKVADVPVGSGVIVAAAKLVVTQPVAGQFHAFTAVCTHRQCLVSKIADGNIECPWKSIQHQRWQRGRGSSYPTPGNQNHHQDSGHP